jgi:DegV family protein with EDD domain
MPRIALVTNVAAAVPPELVTRHAITVVPMQINFLDGHYEELSEITSEEFYERLAKEDVVPSSSPPSVSRYLRTFRALAQDHDTILSIHISQALSGSYHNALVAAEQLPETRIVLHDSASVAMGTGLQVLTAARLIEQGAGIDAVLAALQHQRSRTLFVFAPATLRYVRNSWRVGPIAMLLASWLNIKPVIKMNEGKLDLLDRQRSWEAALSRQIDELTHFGASGQLSEIGISHINAPAEAKAFANRVHACFPHAQIYIADSGPALAVHMGPGALGLATYQT